MVHWLFRGWLFKEEVKISTIAKGANWALAHQFVEDPNEKRQSSAQDSAHVQVCPPLR